MSLKHRILFVSGDNAVRSQMAEALLNQMSDEHYEASSAGVHPMDIDQRTLAALQSMHISATGLHSKPLKGVDPAEFDDIIVLCDKYGAESGMLAHLNGAMLWNFKDPRSDQRPNAFGKTLQEIQQRLQMFLLIKNKDRH